MKIYKLWPDHQYHAFDTKDALKYLRPTGYPVKNWQPITFYPYDHPSEKGHPVGDALPCGVAGAIVVNERCYSVLQPYLKGIVQALPAQTEKEKLYVLNVINIMDCLDYKRAEVVYFPHSERVMRVAEHAFLKEKMENPFIFCIPEKRHGCPFVSDEFKSVIEKNKITGFDFELVWSDEE